MNRPVVDVVDAPVRTPVKAPPASPFKPATDSPFKASTASPFRSASPFRARVGGAPPRAPFRPGRSPFRDPFKDPRNTRRQITRRVYRRSVILPQLGRRTPPGKWSDWLWLPLDELTEIDGCGCGDPHTYLPGMGEDFDEWAAEVAERDGCDPSSDVWGDECRDEHSIDVAGKHLHPLSAVGWPDESTPPIRMASTFHMLNDWNAAYRQDWLESLEMVEEIRTELLAHPELVLESTMGSNLAYDVLTLAGTDIPAGSGPYGLANGAERIQMVYEHLEDDEGIRTAFGDHAVFAYAHTVADDLLGEVERFADLVDTVTDDGVTLASPNMLTMMRFDPDDFTAGETIRAGDMVKLRGSWTARDASYHSLCRDPALAAQFPWMVGWRSVLMKRDGPKPDEEDDDERYNVPLPMFDPLDGA